MPAIENMTPPKVSVIVPVRNGERTLETCLASILATDYPEAAREIIVVDNGSTDRSPELIRRHPVTCLRESARGAGPARNRGILASRGQIVAFTDADCVVTVPWLRELVAAFDTDAVWAVAGEVAPYPPATPTQRYAAMGWPWHQRGALTSERPYFVTMNVAFRRAVFERVGMFDGRFVSGDDQDFAWRYFASGLTLRYAPKALVLHRHRRNAWQFFRQQRDRARDAVLLRRNYGLPWRLRDEIAEYHKLGRAMCALATAASRRALHGRDTIDVQSPLHTVVREIAWRIGTARGSVGSQRRREDRSTTASRGSAHNGHDAAAPSSAVILAYHSIARTVADPHGLCVTPEHLDEQLGALRQRYDVVPLSDFVVGRRDGSSRRRAAIITFDDGYANTLHAAKPILEHHDLPATVFVMSAAIDAPTEFWWDELGRFLLTPGLIPRLSLTVRGIRHSWTCDGARPYTEADARRYRAWRMRDGEDPAPRHRVYRALYAVLQPLSLDERNEALAALRADVGLGAAPRPECRSLTSAELADLIQGGHVDVGGHSVTHPVLSLLSSEQQRHEIRQGKAQLEAAVKRPVTVFAYPYGMPGRHYSAESVMLVREAGYVGACTTAERAVSTASDPWQLPRLVVRDWGGATLLEQIDRLWTSQRHHA